MVHGGDTVYVFVAMIVLSDQDGNLRMHSAALASRIGKNFESVQQAITNLEMPDPVSSTPDHNGRRIIPLSELTDGAENRGWLIVNKSKYRDMSSREDRREYMRKYMRDKRKHEVNNSKRAVSTVEESKPTVSNVSLYTDTDTDTDTEKETTYAGLQPASVPKCPKNEIVSLYHESLPTCPRVQKWTDARERLLRARWREHPALELWEQYFAIVKRSRFLTGKTNGHGERPPFLADFEWLIKPSNFVKVMEGRYDNR